MAIEAEELATISRSIRNAGAETAGEFRQAANASNANLSRIVKDISNTFKAQREDLADLRNVLEEMVSESQQTGNKIDSLNSLFRESLEIQNAMATQLSNVTRNTRNLSGDIESLNRNIMNTSNSGLLGSINNLSSNFAKELATLGIGTAAGFAATSAITGGGGGGIGPGVGESGSSSEAMSFFQSKGWSKEQAAGIVGNLQVESGKNLKTNAVGDSGQAYGIAQWHPDRQAKFQQVMGIPIRQSNFKQQLEFVQWELMNSEKRAGQMLKAASTPIEAARAIDYGYERSSHQHLGQRMANAAALVKQNVSSGNVSPVTPTSPVINPTTTTTPTADAIKVNSPTQETIPSATDPRTERIGKEGGHGPISGAAHEGHAEKTEGSATLPAGDIVALGHALEKMGMRISEHPQFGGVNPVHKGKAHYEGRAIDINVGKGVTEASDPVLGTKFDRLAEQLTRMGYKVYWRESGPYGAAGHNNHLHAELPRGGATPVPDTYQIAGTPEQRALQGATPAVTGTSPISAAPQSTGASVAAEPMSQPPMTGITSPQLGNIIPAQIMGMMGGGIGGIAGMLLPMIASTIQSEMVSMPSVPALNTQAVNQAAVSAQAAEQTIQEAQSSFYTPQVNPDSNRMAMGDNSGFAYNMPEDIGWPDWAGMIGGNHWEEMKNYKKNMSWG